MVIDSLGVIIQYLIVISASLAGLAGIAVLGSFFHDRLKNLFDDTNYFIFFFLVAGYFLYALGEVSFFLASSVLEDTSLVGVHDIYWSGGALLILISFMALAITLFRHEEMGGSSNLKNLLIVGTVVLFLVVLVVFGLIGYQKGHFFKAFYPVISTLIVVASASVLYLRKLHSFGNALIPFFLASLAILLGDIFFHFSAAQSVYNVIGFTADVFYLLGYALSGAAFVVLRLKMNSFAVK